VAIVQVANPGDISVLHAVASLRQHLEFVPLFFFGYVVLRSQRRLAGFLTLLLAAAAANGVADIIQSGLSPAQLGSWGPGYHGLEFGTATRVARVFITTTHQAAVRPPGLGGTDGFGGMVCMLALPGAIALLSSGRRTVKQGWLLIPATILTIAGAVSSQTRLAVVGSLIVLFAFLALTVTSRRGMTALLLTTVVGLVGYSVASTFVGGSANRYESISPSKILTTIPSVISAHGSLTLIPTYATNYPLGAGLGSVGPAGGSAIGGLGKSKGLSGESQLTFLLVETGIPGLLVMAAFALATIRAGLALRRLADPGLQRSISALVAVLIGLLGTWLIGPATADSPTSPFIWLSAGCLAYWYGELRAGRLRTRARKVATSLASR
jgi:hypothetical protein